MSKIMRKNPFNLISKEQFERELTKERKHQDDVEARLRAIEINLINMRRTNGH